MATLQSDKFIITNGTVDPETGQKMQSAVYGPADIAKNATDIGDTTTLATTDKTSTVDAINEVVTNSIYEEVTEGGNTGWRIKGSDPANHGDIGNEAIDSSYSDDISSPLKPFGAGGERSHAEGFEVSARGLHSHAEGARTIAGGEASHAQGKLTLAGFHHGGRVISHNDTTYLIRILGYDANAIPLSSTIVYRALETATCFESTAIVVTNTQVNDSVYGRVTEIVLDSALGLTLDETYLVFEDLDTDYSHAEGYQTASSTRAHSEGEGCVAGERNAHAEGSETTASGLASHSEGRGTLANGSYNHAEGWNTKALGSYSHAEGQETIALNDGSHAAGLFNVGTSTDTIHETGIGADDANRANAFEIYHTDGTLTAPESTIGTITTRGNKAITTKEFVDDALLEFETDKLLYRPSSTQVIKNITDTITWTGDDDDIFPFSAIDVDGAIFDYTAATDTWTFETIGSHTIILMMGSEQLG